jgi:hypothetical protein
MVGLVGISNCRDNLKQLVESQQREITTAVDGNEYRVGHCQAIERCGPHRWRRVNDNDVEVSENSAQLAPKQTVRD